MRIDTPPETDHRPDGTGPDRAGPDWAVTSWEACAGFAAGPDGSPVCAACGWLAEEHGTAAEVRVLPARRVSERPRRLAS